MTAQTKSGTVNTLFLIVTVTTVLSLLVTAVSAQPVGPTVTLLSNSTKTATPGQLINSTINGTISPGGFIFTANLNTLQQNNRWKAYVGNVTGTLTLDDVDDNTIYQWSLASVSGEVYATRDSGTVNWTGINCTWIHTNATAVGPAGANRSAEEAENAALSHTSEDDNITATFATTNHSAITIGSVVIGKNECFTVHTYQNDASQTFTDSDDANFTEIILYDGAAGSNDGSIIYATFIEQDIQGYRNTGTSETYDFQMLLPESGATGFSGSTGYYFYVELT